jgi:hypothetical protein
MIGLLFTYVRRREYEDIIKIHTYIACPPHNHTPPPRRAHAMPLLIQAQVARKSPLNMFVSYLTKNYFPQNIYHNPSRQLLHKVTEGDKMQNQKQCNLRILKYVCRTVNACAFFCFLILLCLPYICS